LRSVDQVKLWHRLAVQFLGGKCRACVSTDNLEIHHKDKNPRNNQIGNLEVLCEKCHRKEHGQGQPEHTITLKHITGVHVRQARYLYWKLSGGKSIYLGTVNNLREDRVLELMRKLEEKRSRHYQDLTLLRGLL